MVRINGAQYRDVLRGYLFLVPINGSRVARRIIVLGAITVTFFQR